MLRKTMIIAITAVLVCSLSACGGNQNTAVQNAVADNGAYSAKADTDTDEKAITAPEENSGENSESKNESSSESSAEAPGQDNTEGGNGFAGGKNNSGNNIPQGGEGFPGGGGQNGSQNAAAGQNTGSAESIEAADTSELFSERDLTQTADTSSAKTIEAASNKTVTITEEGVYIITGSATDFTVKVDASKDAKVQLVLDGLTVSNSNFPVIYVVSADKCFVTTAGSESTLEVTGSFNTDGDTKTDAVIFSKDDLVLNGTGTLNIKCAEANGISGKDDIKITGGTYNITSAKDSIEANDSILIYDGSFNINSSKDGLHCENDDDDTQGMIYIRSGSFNITAASDAVQATTLAQIDGGSFELESAEGIESTKILINDGTINISASDDGINAAQKSSSYGTPAFEITGGSLNITMTGNDVDCIDANGNIIISGGTINLNYTAQGPSEPFDYDGTAQYNGGTIIINGSQVDSIPQSSMMGGRGGMGGMYGMGGMNRRGNMNGANGFSAPDNNSSGMNDLNGITDSGEAV